MPEGLVVSGQRAVPGGAQGNEAITGVLEFLTSDGTGHMRFLHEPGHGLRPAFDMQFIKNIGQLVFHRFVAQAQLEGDFLIGFPFSQKRQNQTLLR